MRKYIFTFGVVALAFSPDPVLAANPFGNWIDEKGKTKVQLYNCAGKVCGKIVWLKKPLKNGKPKTDRKNKKKKLRARQVLGLQITRGLKPHKSGIKWKGKIYNPDEGGTYRATLSLVNAKTAKLNGC